LSVLVPLGAAATVRIHNPHGDITARVVNGNRVRISHSSPERSPLKEDLILKQEPGGLLAVECRPADGAHIDIRIDLTYGSILQAATTNGTISIQGMVAEASLSTQEGAIELTAPWKAMRFSMLAKTPPGEFSAPKGVKLDRSQSAGGWELRDRQPDLKATYGYIRVQSDSPARIVLKDMPLPLDAPVKLHWEAPEILDTIFSKPSGRANRNLPRPETTPKAEEPSAGREIPTFTSDVRLVNLTVAVTDQDGRPVNGLTASDFEVIEDRVPQKLAFAGAGEVPFNLALLLDLSGSTKRNRPAMKEAASRFIDITRPHDRVAAYALANDLFYVVSHLTADRAQLRASIEAIPEVGGGTPLYDALVLSYAEEFRKRPGERNALIVITDGLDNRSEVGFGKLRRAAQEIDALIYPVFLDPFDKVPAPPGASSARRRLEQLADATGGRLFPARSATDLEPVYPLVADELRSVYTLAYYPSNQNFNGTWRAVQVRVKRPDIRLRTRAGYFAR
jgi:VWFA-related protein